MELPFKRLCGLLQRVVACPTDQGQAPGVVKNLSTLVVLTVRAAHTRVRVSAARPVEVKPGQTAPRAWSLVVLS